MFRERLKIIALPRTARWSFTILTDQMLWKTHPLATVCSKKYHLAENIDITSNLTLNTKKYVLKIVN